MSLRLYNKRRNRYRYHTQLGMVTTMSFNFNVGAHFMRNRSGQVCVCRQDNANHVTEWSII